jgi:GT2 family glycosyltransferase
VIDSPADLSVVILTMGNRPAELAASVHSALRQSGVAVDVVVVANGAPASEIELDGDRITIVEASENLGIPGGRNFGAAQSTAELVAFLDDDARFADNRVLARSADAFAADPRLSALALRIVDEAGKTARRHVPRIGSLNPDRSGPATAFLGGAVVIRRAAFDGAGRYPAAFTYAMEETDLALRLIDRGWTIHYDGTPAVIHPRSDPARHHGAAERTMRNRVWLAYRNLPAPLAALYVANWLAISAIRSPRSVRTQLSGLRAGWSDRPRGERAPIRWRTASRLTRLGRPPIV